MARPPLESLRVFAAAARSQSFQAAAGELHLTPSAVSQRIRSFEEMIGHRLFRRLTRQVTLTDEGRLLWQRLQAPLDEIEATLAALTAPVDRPVTVSATASFAQTCLLPALARFQIVHPAIRVRILVEHALASVTGGEVDIGLRQGMGHYPGLETEPLFAGLYVPVAAPPLVDRPQAMPRIDVTWPAGFVQAPIWANWQALTGIELAGPQVLAAPYESVAIQAALAGQGMALVHHRYVADDLANGRLMLPFGPGAGLPTAVRHYAVRARGPARPAVDTVWRWLLETFG